jgi:UDP-N-acetylglucosamine:LPS N-acetylglucosamine transferase
MICGHNAVLAERLRALSAAARPSAPRVILGFTSAIRYYMQLCDFFIGKPGPGSISEAVQQGLPVIVTGNAWTMPQERYNIEWVRENRAVFEIPEILDRIMQIAKPNESRPVSRVDTRGSVRLN